MTELKLNNLITIGLNQFENLDLTGKTGLSDSQKDLIFSEFVNNHVNKVYFTKLMQSVKVKGSLKDGALIDVSGYDISQSIKTALIYIGYTDGNFVWTDYLLISEGNDGTNDGYLYINIDKSMPQIGQVFSALNKQISEFGKSTTHESNLQKMMKRNKYRLVNKDQKAFLFGKGHMSAGNLKTIVKRDLDMLFEFMNLSKQKANSGDVSPVEFPIDNLRFFKFEKF